MTLKSCQEYAKHSPQPSQPLISSSLPEYPWQKVASDLFHYKGKTYLLCIDYFSRYPEVVTLNSTTSKGVIEALKSIFAHHGTPETLISDNGHQYSAVEIKDFASTYAFEHVTSSPHYPRSNGLAERTIKTIKKSSDLNMLLLSYRCTPLLWCNLSPSELLMERRVRTTIPQVSNQLIPEWSFLPEFHKQDEKFKRESQSLHNDNVQKFKDIPSIKEITEAEHIWIKSVQTDFFLSEKEFLASKSQVVPRRVNQFGLFMEGEIMKCQGKIDNSTLPLNSKRPILPPSHHPFVDLLIRQYHERSKHGGVNDTLMMLRERYWILSGKELCGMSEVRRNSL